MVILIDREYFLLRREPVTELFQKEHQDMGDILVVVQNEHHQLSHGLPMRSGHLYELFRLFE